MDRRHTIIHLSKSLLFNVCIHYDTFHSRVSEQPYNQNQVLIYVLFHYHKLRPKPASLFLLQSYWKSIQKQRFALLVHRNLLVQQKHHLYFHQHCFVLVQSMGLLPSSHLKLYQVFLFLLNLKQSYSLAQTLFLDLNHSYDKQQMPKLPIQQQ